LTEREAAARRKCVEALERECRRAGTHSSECDHTAGITEGVIRQAAIRVLACNLSPEQIELCISGIYASEEDRERNEKESAADEAYRAETERLSLLAGFGSVAEFDALMWSVNVAESADRC
jgi:hypothetical protein